MGYRELITHLQKEGEEKIRQLWADTERKAEQIRKESMNRAEDIRSEFIKEQITNAGEQEENIIADSRKKAGAIGLSAEKALAERIYNISRSLLHTLRNEKYKDVFTSLCSEIPVSDWSEVRVNPQDRARAARCFPDSRIVNDDSISGGLDVMGNENKIRVINTLEKRLEKAWEDILPFIMKDASGELPDDDTHSAA